MSLRASSDFDAETPLTTSVHESSLTPGKIVGSLDVGDRGELVLIPQSRTDIDRMITALIELGTKWDAEDRRLQPALILVDLESEVKS